MCERRKAKNPKASVCNITPSPSHGIFDLTKLVIMGASWQRRASGCFVVDEDAKMAPRLACCHQQHGYTEKDRCFSSGDSSDLSSDTKWWLKESYEEEVTHSLVEYTKCEKQQEFVDLIGLGKEEEEDYSFICKKDIVATTPWPWWRTTTDTDELGLLVETKSVIQNCDLPPPQKLYKRIHGFKTVPWKQGGWSDELERSLSYTSSSTASPKTPPRSRSRSDDLSKAQLLEALRHSQTRARKAEEAVREACAEKDRVITILLRQASQMLAYKQWLKILEMEALYLQTKKEEEIKGMNLNKRKKKKKKKKMGEVGRYVMAFAIGFSLIGAGLLLGWTAGWFFHL